MNPQNAAVIPFPRTQCVVLAGNPNVGKSTLFNALTGSRQKIANYPGVTVEKKTGTLKTPSGKTVRIVDLPGAYSLQAGSEDEAIASACIQGRVDEIGKPDMAMVVVEAARLDRGLLLFRQIQAIHPRTILVLNMMDELKKEKLEINRKKLSELIDAPVLAISARLGEGIQDVVNFIDSEPAAGPAHDGADVSRGDLASFARIDDIVGQVLKKSASVLTPKVGAKECGLHPGDATEKLDAVLLHPVLGPLIFLFVMLIVFQSLFTWSAPLMEFIDSGIGAAGERLLAHVDAPWLKSLVGDGIIAGVGSVLVFVPQIAVTFLLIGILEMTGYLARGAFLIDRLMRAVGLEGRAFIPLISSFACAVPGIMAARTVPNARQRLITILIAPLMTCSARLPVYTLLIATFIPPVKLFGAINAQGLTLFALFCLGIATGMGVAFVLDRILPNRSRGGFFIELPKYRLPTLRNVYYYVSFRTGTFLKTAGTTIFMLSVALWFLAYFPRSTAMDKVYDLQVQDVAARSVSDERKAELTAGIENERAGEMLRYSFIGRLGHAIEPALKPLGFDWRLGIGILTSFAAREVFVSTMGIVFNLGSSADENSQSLRHLLQSAETDAGRTAYTLRTALALLAFFALAAQCMSTLAVMRRETNSRRWPAVVFLYMSGLAYLAAFLTYQGLGWLGMP
jgi:ferrous iron transport protein B